VNRFGVACSGGRVTGPGWGIADAGVRRDGTRALVGWAIALTPHAGTVLTPGTLDSELREGASWPVSEERSILGGAPANLISTGFLGTLAPADELA
jgi:hypothetical protein